MKKATLFFALFFSLSSLFALSIVSPPKAPVKASSIRFQVGPDKQWVSLEDIANMKARDYAELTHRHMDIFQRAAFSIAQRKLRNSINADGTINNKRLEKMIAPMNDGETGFHIGGFALGFLVGLIGVLIAYLINDEKKRNRVKWAWLGFGAAVILYLIIILAAA